MNLFVVLQEWFAGCIYTFANELPRLSPTQPIVRVMSELGPMAQNGTVDGLQQLAKEFEDLADTCLLVLHLEVCMIPRLGQLVIILFMY